MDNKPIRHDSIRMAVDITVAAVPIQPGTWITTPDTVAKFIETVARKIDELRGPQ